MMLRTLLCLSVAAGAFVVFSGNGGEVHDARAESARETNPGERPEDASGRPGDEERPSAGQAKAALPDHPASFVNSLGMKMVLIPAGSFEMGWGDKPAADGGYDLSPRHEVTISKPFYMAAYELSKGRFRQFARETGIEKEIRELDPDAPPTLRAGEDRDDFRFGNYELGPSDDYPVSFVDWELATQFCEWLSKREGRRYRLPTEAEWEYAARAGTSTWYWWGDDERWPLYVHRYQSTNREERPQRSHDSVLAIPGSYPANPWGLYEVHGNAAEWTSDWYDPDYYVISPKVDPEGPQTEITHVRRGGWWSSIPVVCNSSHRSTNAVTRGSGIRVVCEIGENLKPPEVARTLKVPEQVLAQREMHIVELAPDIKMELVRMEPGVVLLGSPESEPFRAAHEAPRIRVTHTEPFYIGRYEVTQAQYEAIMKENPSRYPGADRPVDSVLWGTAHRFCQNLTDRERAAGRLPVDHEYRLPTEAEWEYACRAGSETAYHFGDDPMLLGRFAWSDTTGGTRPVGKKLANAWGLYDMHGNVAEWVADHGWKYPEGDHADYVGRHFGGASMVRGGAWNFSPHRCRSAARTFARSKQVREGGEWIHYGDDFVGFRIVMRKVMKEEEQYNHFLRPLRMKDDEK